MKEKIKRIITLLLLMTIFTNLLPTVPLVVKAKEGYTVSSQNITSEISENVHQTYTYVNPLYENKVKNSDLKNSVNAGVSVANDLEESYCSSIQEAGEIMRQQMKNRMESFQIHYQTTDDNYEKITTEISDEAMRHTGVPTEGDYLRFQYAGWNCDLSGSVTNDTYFLVLTYTVTYYTTLQQENAVDNAVTGLLNEFELSDKSNYEKIKLIYDYICSNITYDYDNLYDDSYKLKYTAYDALINKTAVCQGYAVLLYRLLLESNIDCRIISGTGNDELHAWNIIRLEDFYYNTDTTWDAGKDSYNYFLKSEENFSDHIRNSEYMTEAFYADYPMSEKDYAAEAYTYTEGNVVYSIENNTATVIGYTDNPVNLVIPEKVDNIIVKKIEAGAFMSCESLESVTLPASLERIEGFSSFQAYEDGYNYSYGGTGGFTGCTNLAKVDIPQDSKLTYIGDSTFENTAITTLFIPDSVSYIGTGVFYECGSLADITLPENLEIVSDVLFYKCSNLKEIVLPENVTSIGAYAFCYCTGLESIDINGNVCSIGTGCFMNCSSLADLNIPSTVSEIGSKAFNHCQSITELTIPNGVQYIGKATFTSCSNLETLHLPESLKEIGEYAFCNCSKLTGTIKIPDGQTYIGDWTFVGCEKLECITIPKSVTSIGDSAFHNCQGLEEGCIKLPENVVSIGANAFYQCKGLSGELLIPEGIESIGDWTFAYTNITSVSIPESVTSIGIAAFYWCSKLGGIIKIPENVTSIEEHTFAYTDIEQIIFPENLLSIGEYAFDGCLKLDNIILPDQIKEIRKRTFSNCQNLNSIVIPDNVTSIGEEAFAWCYSLKDISLSENLNYIGERSFDYCSALSKITIPKNVTEIGDYAFNSCSSLNSIYFNGSIPEVGDNFLSNVTATAYYPTSDPSWTDDVMQNYGGTITWKSYSADPVENPFTDVKESEYYYDAVLWAYDYGITSGATETTFKPDATCTRAQTVTFLWRAMGEPEPESVSNPFIDIKSSEYYYDAVLWAYQNGIVNGVTNTTFCPDTMVTRAQVVTFLWRAEGQPSTTIDNPFTDVKSNEYYYDAVLWAYDNGITSGATETLFKPTASCTRAQVVTFLYRDMH